MALELSVFLVMLIVGVGSFVLGYGLKQSYLYILGSITIFFSGVAPMIFDGLLIERITSGVVNDVITYDLVTLDTSNVLLVLLSLVLCGIGFISLISLSLASSGGQSSRRVFHY